MARRSGAKRVAMARRERYGASRRDDKPLRQVPG